MNYKDNNNENPGTPTPPKNNINDSIYLCVIFCPISHPLPEITILLSLVFNIPLLFFLFIFLLKDNCFTEFCCFLSNLSMNQP